MDKQETEMKRKLELKTEKEIGNRNGSKKKTQITGAMFSS